MAFFETGIHSFTVRLLHGLSLMAGQGGGPGNRSMPGQAMALLKLATTENPALGKIGRDRV